MHGNEIFNTSIEGVPSTCLVLGGKDMDLPSYLLQGEKEFGYIYQNGTLRSWLWKGLTIANGKRCLYFDRLPIYSIWDLAGAHQKDALETAKDLCRALPLLDDAFLNVSSGILPLWRMYGIEGGGVLLFPQSLGDLISSCSDENERYANLAAWVHHDIHPAFGLCDQIVQILYMAASGQPPFLSPQSREDSFRAVPLSLMRCSLDEKTVTFIDDTLALGLTRQRDIAGNGPEQRVLGSWMITELQALSWGENITTDTKNPECVQFLQKQNQRADRRVFWRKKGWLVITIAVAALIVGGFIRNRIKLALTPPYTNGMSDTEIIEEYYTGQTELDVEKMGASLAKHVKNPAEMEVTNLYVTRQTRKAYESMDAVVNVREWIATGKPAITEGANLYGITDVRIKALDSDSYQVESDIWTPYPYEDGNGVPANPGHATVYHYTQTQRFVMTTNKRGWRLIASITNLSYRFVGTEEVEVKPNTQTKALGMQTGL